MATPDPSPETAPSGFLTAVAGGLRLDGLEPDGACVATARAIVARAEQEAGDDKRRRASRLELEAGALRARLTELAAAIEHAFPAAGVSDRLTKEGARYVAAAFAREALDGGAPALDVDRLLERALAAYFVATPEPSWAKAHGLLCAGRERAAVPELKAAIASVLGPRAPDDWKGRLDRWADVTANELAADWRLDSADIPTATSLRSRACTDAWRLLVADFAKNVSYPQLARIAGRSLVLDQHGTLDHDEAESVKHHLVRFAPLVHLDSRERIAAVASLAPRVGRGRDSSLDIDWRPDAGDGSESVVELAGDAPDAEAPDGLERAHEAAALDGFTADDLRMLSERMDDIAVVLRVAVGEAMRGLLEGDAVMRRAATILDCVDRAGGYAYQTVLDALADLAGDGTTYDERDEAHRRYAEVQLTRAYDRLRVPLANEGFVLLEDRRSDAPPTPDAVLDAMRHTLPLGLPTPFGPLPADLPADEARALELDERQATLMALEHNRKPLHKIVAAQGARWPRNTMSDADCVEAVELIVALKGARRAVRRRLRLRSPAIWFAVEPVIRPTTDLPEGVPRWMRMPLQEAPADPHPAMVRGGRVLAMHTGASPDGPLPIERKTNEASLMPVVPLLPEPLVKTHVGRWWYFPARGVAH